MQFIVDKVADLAAAAERMIAQYPQERIFLFYGHMGAGKTTFINALCAALEVQDSTSSPTFSIVNEYASSHGPLFHFDFYRLKDESEALDLGYEEYFYSGITVLSNGPKKSKTSFLRTTLRSPSKLLTINPVALRQKKSKIFHTLFATFRSPTASS